MSVEPSIEEAHRLPDHLRVEGLVCGYGKKQVLNGVSLEVVRGQIVALIGHNGAGKSTLLKAVFGMIPIWEGRVYLNGEAQPKPTPRGMLHSGVRLRAPGKPGVHGLDRP